MYKKFSVYEGSEATKPEVVLPFRHDLIFNFLVEISDFLFSKANTDRLAVFVEISQESSI